MAKCENGEKRKMDEGSLRVFTNCHWERLAAVPHCSVNKWRRDRIRGNSKYRTTMAPGGYKDDTFLVIQPGAQHTLVTLGLQDPLGLPTLSAPTRVYVRQGSNENGESTTLYSMTEQEGYVELLPIVMGTIVDLEALKFFIHSIAVSVLKEREEDEDQHTLAIESVNLLIVQSSSNWNPIHIEKIVNFGFETMKLHSIAVVPIALCSVFAFGSIANALVIDIGYEKSEILPVIDYQLFSPSKTVIYKGGNTINESLAKLLPTFSKAQIESLKKSSVFECLSEEDAKKSFFGMEGLIENIDDNNNDDDGVLDIAAIVTSDKSTREILETTTKKGKKEVDTRPNSELETNTFVDDDGKELTIGKERFQGCGDLIDDLVLNIYHSLRKIPDLKKRQDCYDNIIITGQTSKIKGLKEKIMFHLFDKYVVLSDNKLLQPQSQFRNDVRPVDDSSITQVPRHLRLVPKIDYFHEWKKHGFEDCSFLGAQILSKQVFTPSNEFCLSKETYDESGPSAIWSIHL